VRVYLIAKDLLLQRIREVSKNGTYNYCGEAWSNNKIS